MGTLFASGRKMLTIKLVDAMGTKYLVGEYNLFVKDFLRRCMSEVHGVKDLSLIHI